MITQHQVLRDTQAIFAGYLLYATVVAKGIFVLPLVFTTAHLAVIEELARGSLAIFLGPWVGMGAALYEAISWDFSPIDTLQHLILFAPSHIALSLLWSRHRLTGGLLAITTHMAWNSLIATKLWLIPMLLIPSVYGILLWPFLQLQPRSIFDEKIT